MLGLFELVVFVIQLLLEHLPNLGYQRKGLSRVGQLAKQFFVSFTVQNISMYEDINNDLGFFGGRFHHAK